MEFDFNDKEKIYPTVEIMRKLYDFSNEKYFNGKLGECNFNVFTSGKGSMGGVLGWFKFGGKNIMYHYKTNRRMYYPSYHGEIDINEDNFVLFCKPIIELNGNYKWTIGQMLNTMVHEMCHYYTYMEGYVPKQGHGREWKYIASVVSSRSDGFFTIKRVADAERMSDFELKQEIVDKNTARFDNKVSRLMALLVRLKDGKYELTTSTSMELFNMIARYYKDKPNVFNVSFSKDKDLIKWLVDKGYNKNMRSHRFYVLNDAMKNIMDNQFMDAWYVMYSKNDKDNVPSVKQRKFRLKTNKGEVIINFVNDNDLFNKLRERFPKLNDEMINKLMSNKNNYMNENVDYNEIINKVIREYIEENVIDNNDSMPIDGSMNLGLMVPDEMI